MDSWKFTKIEKGIKNRLFTEWRYFNFIDEEINGFFSYFLLDPSNKIKISRLAVNSLTFYKNNKYSQVEIFSRKNLNLSSDNKNLSLENNGVRMSDNGDYLIYGESEELKWKLNFNKLVNNTGLFNEDKIDVINWQKIYWQIFHPISRVRGEIIFKNENETKTILGTGYADANWGNWFLLNAMWFWAQCNKIYEKNKYFYLALYEIYNKKLGHIFIDVNGKKFNFPKKYFIIEHKKWKTDQETGIKSPCYTIVKGVNGKISLQISIRTLDSEVRTAKGPGIIPNLYINTDFCEFTCDIDEVDNRYRFQTKGFREYTIKDKIGKRIKKKNA